MYEIIKASFVILFWGVRFTESVYIGKLLLVQKKSPKKNKGCLF